MGGRRRDSKQRATLFDPLAPRSPCNWADNAKSSGPCLVNSTAICNDDEQCVCSTVSYLLAAACDFCETPSRLLSWHHYAQDLVRPPCVAPFFEIPAPFSDPHLDIPGWALILAQRESLTTTPTFDPTQASTIGVSLQLHGTPSPLVSTSSSSTLSTTFSATAIDSHSASSSLTSNGVSSTNAVTSAATNSASVQPHVVSAAKATSQAGPIAGGIIGGALFLVLVGLAIWYTVVRRRRNHIAPSAAYKAALRAGSPMPYQSVHPDSPKNSISCQNDDLRTDRPSSSWLPSAAVSIHSDHQSRFLEHT
ncbi:hypothetical protein B0H10DRAFT_2009966 [Mycena sp. CBHHK59/15]|nr:hypothetical protein B0H10DRAFT_2009966 [Mycena sp. CBHHK59/15]